MNKITNIASLLMLTVQAAMCLVACGHAGVYVGDMSWLFAVSVATRAAIAFLEKRPQYYNYPRNFRNPTKAGQLLGRLIGILKLITVTTLTLFSLDSYAGTRLCLPVAVLSLLALAAATFVFVRKLNKT